MRLLLLTSPYELPSTRSLTVFPLSDIHVAIRPYHLADPIRAIVIIIPEINTAITECILTETTFFVWLPEALVYSSRVPAVYSKPFFYWSREKSYITVPTFLPLVASKSLDIVIVELAAVRPAIFWIQALDEALTMSLTMVELAFISYMFTLFIVPAVLTKTEITVDRIVLSVQCYSF
jgi:hypothetical protein